MKLTSEEVIEYYARMMPGLQFDKEVLDAVIDSFDYPVSMYCILCRHNDVLAGDTVIDNGMVYLSARSSITELDISNEVVVASNKGCVYRIGDIDKCKPEGMMSLTEDIVDALNLAAAKVVLELS